MGKNKKAGKTQKWEQRKQKARQWLLTYNGQKVVRAYRKRFHVDTACAVRELQEIGYNFEPGYIENLLKAEAARLEANRRRKEEEADSRQGYDFQDDRFYFIAGYTSGGAPYGVTWEQMGLEPYENEFDDEEPVTCYRHYEFLSEREKAVINNRLREDFSAYVRSHRRFPGRQKRGALIERVFETAPGGPLYYDKDFHTVYRKIVRKRENAFIREGVLPRRFSPTEIKAWLEKSVMLESERLIFRKITPDDFDDLAGMLRDSEVTAAWERPFTDEEIQKWIDRQLLRYRDHIVGYFAAIRKDTGEFIGQMGLMWSDFDELRALEIGYMLKREFWGMGFAAEGAAALSRFAFDEIGVNKVYAAIRPCNERSVRVAKRIGMVPEGSFIKQFDGKDMEHIIYAKDRDDARET